MPFFVLLLLLQQMPLLPYNAGARENTRRYDYTYDFWGIAEESTPAFTLDRTLDKNGALSRVNLSGVDDAASGGGKLFLVDSAESRLNILNEKFEFVSSLKLLYTSEGRIALDERGRQITLTGPEGVFFHKKTNEIFIADTGAERILVLDGEKFFLKRVINRPVNMTGVTKFEPSKIVVDHANRIYTVVQSGFEGIIELNENGSFSRYFGVNKPKINIVEYFWKVFATNAQREKMAKTFAPAFNNIDIDEDGFIYATTYDANSQYMVYRLNPKGENVLLQQKESPVAGDFSPGLTAQFVDIAVNDYGVYAVLDRTTGRIFIYNFYGELVSIITAPLGIKGSFTAPSAVSWFGDYLIAADKQQRRAYVYAMTDFGRLVMDSVKHYYNGEWEAQARLLEEVLRLNANYDLAYSGIGKYHLMRGDYQKAMYYLKLGQNRTYYSQAFNHYRNEWVKNNFFWFALLFAACLGILVYTEIRHHRKGGAENAAAD
ncbi:MAG: hypothetical protein LBG76_05240 [Treponema sp.]|jgi:DNA-binding beta-propeller fold protein YncE|nr:hypothetical protein [Treponema sp.]